MPGIMPLFAISRKQRRESLNFLRNPRARPVSWQRLRSRTGEELRGILLSAILASWRSSSLLFISRMIFFEALSLFPFKVYCSFTPFLFCNRRFCRHILSLKKLLFFTSCRALLPLLAVGVCADNIYTSTSADNFIAFWGVSLNRCSHFHEKPTWGNRC